jgi:hypothetical protein
MTYIVGNHTESIEQASMMTKTISRSLEKAITITNSIDKTLTSGSLIVDAAVVIIIPISGLLLFNYGLQPTMTRNAILIFSGLAVAGAIVLMRHCSWSCIWRLTKWTYNSTSASSLTQLAREKVGSLTTAPVELELA